MDSQIFSLISEAANQYGLPENLFRAQISAESGFDSSAVSRRGAVGIMQFMPSTAKAYGLSMEDLKDTSLDGVKKQIFAGAHYMKDLLSIAEKKGYSGDEAYQQALVGYNAGPSRMGKPWFDETKNYIGKIFGGIGIGGKLISSALYDPQKFAQHIVKKGADSAVETVKEEAQEFIDENLGLIIAGGFGIILLMGLYLMVKSEE